MITGNIKILLIFTAIIIIHELGHLLAALFYHWQVQEIIILPFGGLTIFKEKINRPLIEEFIVLIMGPIFQIIGTIFLYYLTSDTHIIYYSKILLIVNFLPIYPLDGSKLLNIILNKVLSFKTSHMLTIYISFITIFITVLKNNFNLILLLILIFLSIKDIEEYCRHNYIFNAFLLERHINTFKFKKEKIITKVSQMKKDYRHIFKEKNKYITERTFLNRMFDRPHKL